MKCEDENCPVHGSLKTRGAILEGVVVSTKPKKTAVIRRDYYQRVPKYERLEKRRGKLSVHVPPCMEVKVGDRITVMECRKISKTKSHVVLPQKKSETK
ncbi:MAG: 30S ribosomal protein S17 [Candidatus Micrarchaeia archaeon]